MKYWIVRDESDNTKLAIIGSTQTPKEALGIAPKNATHAEDLSIITETDEFGEEQERIVIDEAKRQARLDREAQQKLEQEQREQARLDKKRNMRRKTEGLDIESVTSVEDIKALLTELVIAVKDLQDRAGVIDDAE